MIDIQFLLDAINDSTSIPAELSRSREIDLQDLTELPMVYIGYASIDAANPNLPIANDIYNQLGEDLYQTFDLHIVCLQKDLSTTWRTVYSALVGKTPSITQVNLAAVSGLTYRQGGMIGFSNGKCWWQDRWAIGMPTVPVLF